MMNINFGYFIYEILDLKFHKVSTTYLTHSTGSDTEQVLKTSDYERMKMGYANKYIKINAKISIDNGINWMNGPTACMAIGKIALRK